MKTELKDLKKCIQQKLPLFAELNQEGYCHFCKQYIFFHFSENSEKDNICKDCAKKIHDENCECEEFLYGTFESNIIHIECSDHIEIAYPLFQYNHINEIADWCEFDFEAGLIRTNNLSKNSCLILQIYVTKKYLEILKQLDYVRRYYVGLCDTLQTM